MKKILVLAILAALVFSSCGAGFMREVKTFTSNYGGGLERRAMVFSSSGQILKTYEGRFDIEANEYGNKVLFDVDGKRVTIYNACVIVEEK